MVASESTVFHMKKKETPCDLVAKSEKRNTTKFYWCQVIQSDLFIP